MPQRKREMQILDFFDIDTGKINFLEPKPNKHNGSKIGILYIMVRLCMSNMNELLPLA